MQKDESILINEIFRTKAKLSELSGQKRKIAVQLESKKRSLRELEMIDTKMVYQKIDNVILPRDIVIVVKEVEEKIVFLSDKLHTLKKMWEEEYSRFKRLNAEPIHRAAVAKRSFM